MSQSAISRAPIEVWEHAIGFIGTENHWDNHVNDPETFWSCRNALYSCGLVCKPWASISQIHLYRYVSLDGYQGDSFLATITASGSGQLVQHVHGLRIYFGEGGSHMDCVYKLHRVRFPNLYFLGYHSLPDAEPLFFASSPWHKTVKSLRLQKIENWTFTEIARLLNRFPNLHMLTVIDGIDDIGRYSPIAFYSPSPLPNQKQVPSSTNTSFNLQLYEPNGNGVDEKFVDAILYWLIKQQPLSSLTHFTVTCDCTLPVRSQIFKDFVRHESRSLEYLDLSFYPHDDQSGDGSSQVENLSATCWWQCRLCIMVTRSDEVPLGLTELELCGNLKDFTLLLWEPELSEIPWIKRTLSHLPGSIHRIAFVFNNKHEIFTSLREEDHDSDPLTFWRTIDTILSGPVFPQLMQVEIRWQIYSPQSPQEELDVLMTLHCHHAIFQKLLPDTFKNDVLWGGFRLWTSMPRHIMFPITRKTYALGKDTAAWMQESKPSFEHLP